MEEVLMGALDRKTRDPSLARRRYGRRRGFGETAVQDFELERRSSAVARVPPDEEEISWLVDRLNEQNQLFQFLQPDLKRRVAGKMFQRHIPKRDVLFRQHDNISQDCFVVGDGKLEEYKEDDPTHVIRELETGALFGELALLYQTPRTTSVRAVKTTSVWVLSRSAYYAALEDGGKAMQRDLLDQIRTQVPFFTHAPGKKLQMIALTMEKESLKEGAPIAFQSDELDATGGLVYLQPERGLLGPDGERMAAQTFIVICSEEDAALLDSELERWNAQYKLFLGAVGELNALRKASRENLRAVMDDSGEDLAEKKSSGAIDLNKLLAASSKSVSSAALRLGEAGEIEDLEAILRQTGEKDIFDMDSIIAVSELSEEKSASTRSSSPSKQGKAALAPLAVSAKPNSSVPKEKSPPPPQRARGQATPLRIAVFNTGMSQQDLPRAGPGGAELHKTGLNRFRALCSKVYEIEHGLQHLRHMSTFANLSMEAFSALEHMLSERKNFSPSEKIIQQGEKSTELYLLLKGEAVVTLVNDSGGGAAQGSVTVCTRLHAGDFFGEYGALDGTPRTATVTASTPCVCAVLKGKSVPSLPAEVLEQLKMMRKTFNYKDASRALQFNDLEYLSELGQGGYGTVVLCRHIPTDDAVAVKVMLRSAIKTPRQRNNILGERQRLLELRHPFIVQMLGTFKDSKRLMLAMEFVAGGELFSLLEQVGTLNSEEALFTLASVTLMLEHIHSRDFVYRDLKPENVMLSSDGFLKLVDFGFCKRVPASEHAFTPCGTPEYVAPEIATLQGYGREVDWWSCGVLIYDCLHSYTPFSNRGNIQSDMVIMGNIRDASFPIAFDPDVPPMLEDVCRGLMQHSRSARFGAAKVRAHAACGDVDFQALLNKAVTPPFSPSVMDQFDVSNFDPELEEGLSGEELFDLEVGEEASATDWDADF